MLAAITPLIRRLSSLLSISTQISTARSLTVALNSLSTSLTLLETPSLIIHPVLVYLNKSTASHVITLFVGSKTLRLPSKRVTFTFIGTLNPPNLLLSHPQHLRGQAQLSLHLIKWLPEVARVKMVLPDVIRASMRLWHHLSLANGLGVLAERRHG